MIKTKIKNKNKKFNLSLINKFFFSIIISLGLCYLFCINDLSVKSFHIENLRGSINKLKAENINLENKVVALNSYNNLSQKITALNMVPSEKIDYITGNSVIAIKR